MQPIDTKLLSERLGDLAELFDRKPPTERAVRGWFDVLREFPTEKICGVLIGWPRSHAKFPAPNEVWKVVNDFCISDREKKAEVERKATPFEHPGVGGAQAEKFIAEMRRTLNKPQWTPREHWEKVLERAKPGSIGHRYASEVLKKSGSHSQQREPGQDEEERAAA